MGFLFFGRKKEKNEQTKKYNLGMKKTRKGLLGRLKQVLTGYNEVTEELFDAMVILLEYPDKIALLFDNI